MLDESKFTNSIELTNQYQEDVFMQKLLMFYTDAEYENFKDDLSKFGEETITSIWQFGKEAERVKPFLRQYSPYGQRVDELQLSIGWIKQKEIAAKHELIKIAYTSENRFRRFHQAAKLILYSPSSGMYSCPLAMTDGAAFLLQNYIKKNKLQANSFLQKAYDNLTSGDPKKFWTAGQWMTEKLGGSDVKNSTQTVAEFFKEENGHEIYKLFGYKFFSSATDADISFALAKIKINSQIQEQPSLFLIRVRSDDKINENLKIVRLKDKLGTRQLPTAELLLEGVEGILIGQKHKGIKEISPILNITRIHNSISAVSYMRRILQICKDFNNKRVAFGKPIIQHDLQQQVFSKMELDTRGCYLLLFKALELLSITENQQNSFKSQSIRQNEQNQNQKLNKELTLLRLITPLLKLFTAKYSFRTVSEGIEALGALGYMEDSYIPYMLRDSQVLSIWEGTTNVLVLDFLKIFKSNQQSVQLLKNFIEINGNEKLLHYFQTILNALATKDAEFNGRKICFGICKILISCLAKQLYSKTKEQDELLLQNYWEKESEQEVFYFTTYQKVQKSQLKSLLFINRQKNSIKHSL